MYIPGRLRTASKPSRTVMSLASYEAPPPLPFAVALPPAPLGLFEPFDRAFSSAKKFLSSLTENPDRRWPQIGLRTSVGAIDQVDIKDTSFGPRKYRTDE